MPNDRQRPRTERGAATGTTGGVALGDAHQVRAAGAVKVVDLAARLGYAPAPAILGSVLVGENAMLEFEPNVVVPMHEHPQKQIGLVLRGLKFSCDGQEFELGPRQDMPCRVAYAVAHGRVPTARRRSGCSIHNARTI